MRHAPRGRRRRRHEASRPWQVGINGVQDSLRLLPDDTGGPARMQQRSAAHNVAAGRPCNNMRHATRRAGRAARGGAAGSMSEGGMGRWVTAAGGGQDYVRTAALTPLGVTKSAARLTPPLSLPLTETRRRGARALRCRDRRARVPRWHARRGIFHGRPRRDDVPHPNGDVDRLCDNGCAREQSAASPAPPIRAAPRRCLFSMSPGAAGPLRLRLCVARAVMPQRFVFRVRSARGFISVACCVALPQVVALSAARCSLRSGR
jgi:hypothetical protein